MQKKYAFIALGSFALSLMVAAPVAAATLTVDPGNIDEPNGIYGTIAAAVAAAAANDTIEVVFGTYDESVTINKSLTITGIPNGGGDLPVVTRTTGTNQPLFRLSGADDVTISNFRFELVDSIANVGVVKDDASGSTTYLTVLDCEFVKTGNSASSIPNLQLNTTSAAIIANDVRGTGGNPGVIIRGNEITGPFQRPVFLRGSNGFIGGPVAADGNSINGTFMGAIVQFVTGGDLTIENNTFNGGSDQIDLTEPNAPNTVTIRNNVFNAAGNFRGIHLKNHYIGTQASPVTTIIEGNTINTGVYGISVSNNRRTRIRNNTFIPTGASFAHIEVNNKIFTNSNGSLNSAFNAVPLDLEITGNTFNGPAVASPTAIGITFRDHNNYRSTVPSDVPYSFFVGATQIGSVDLDADRNTFAETLGLFVELDANSGDSTSSPLYPGLNANSLTQMTPFAFDVTLGYNSFELGGVTYDDTRDVLDNGSLQSDLYAKFQEFGDNSALGEVIFDLPVPSNVSDWMMLND